EPLHAEVALLDIEVAHGDPGVEVAGVMEDGVAQRDSGDDAGAAVGLLPVIVAAQLELDVVALVEAGAGGGEIGGWGRAGPGRARKSLPATMRRYEPNEKPPLMRSRRVGSEGDGLAGSGFGAAVSGAAGAVAVGAGGFASPEGFGLSGGLSGAGGAEGSAE